MTKDTYIKTVMTETETQENDNQPHDIDPYGEEEQTRCGKYEYDFELPNY